MQINSIQYDLQIPFDSKSTKYFTDIAAIYPIPSDTIICKTVTGIGATYGEIKADRNSIIVLPHISIVTSKHDAHKTKDDTFAVYHKVTVDDVHKYLKKPGRYKKFLTTPRGVDKILKALKRETDGRTYSKNDFFFLVDECHKLLQDAMYREDMVEMMEHFFTFKSKAMISATPIPPSDPRFEMQQFKHIRIYPSNSYEKPILLVHAESVLTYLKEYIENSSATHICIFFNSIDGIVEILNKLEINTNYTIFCSLESAQTLYTLEEPNVSHEMSSLTKYNFFTSSFFNGLDIQLEHDNVDVLLISSVMFRQHTVIDPFTDTLQIIGRFRNGYNQAIHINQITSGYNPISQVQAQDNILKSKVIYEAIYALKQSYFENDFELLLKQALDAVKPYANLVDKDNNYSYFLADNYLDDCRVNQYYRNVSSLKKAYIDARLYLLEEDRKDYKKSQRIGMDRSTLKHRATNIKKIADMLLELEEISSSDTYEEQRAVIKERFPIVFDGYERLGYEYLQLLEFNKKAIVGVLLLREIAEKKNSLPVIDAISVAFFVNRTYLMPEIKKTLQSIYDELDIKVKAKATDIELYYHVKTYNKYKDGRSNRAYILQEAKFNPTVRYQRV